MFKKAKQIWLKGKTLEVNLQAKFSASFTSRENMTLLVTGATVYKVSLNGEFIHHGPAPTATGLARVDRVPLKVESGIPTTLEIEVAGYNTSCYASVNQPSFIIAEVVSGGDVLVSTGEDFEAFLVRSRVRKVSRYAGQRHFSEVYDLKLADTPEQIEIIDSNIKYRERKAPLPEIKKEALNVAFCKSSFTYKDGFTKKNAEDVFSDFSRSLNVNGFPEEEIKHRPMTRYLAFDYKLSDAKASLPVKLSEGEYCAFGFPHNSSGIISLKFRAEKGAKIYIAFSEFLKDGKFSDNIKADNIIEITASGDVDFLNHEIYGFMYFGVFAVDGEIELYEASRILVRCSPDFPALNTDDPDLLAVYSAALESFRCNSLGIFMDCPTRERAGWLCDSTYISRAAYRLMGNTLIEEDFLENYNNHKCKTIPRGMVPMCYPAEHISGRFIPQWSLWLIIEIYEFKKRRTDADVNVYRDLIYGLFGYFERFENELGLLESLESWNFVEWSRANDWCQGINFPTNMLYAYALTVAAELYSDPSLRDKAEKIKKLVREMSYDGEFFHDQALRDEHGTPRVNSNISEVCQYYALYFGTAKEEDYPELVERLVEKFGPDSENYPEIEKANALMGIYLRIDLLVKWGRVEQCLEEIKGYFLRMATLTGTLWEHKNTAASLNHGFPSYIAAVLLDIFNK